MQYEINHSDSETSNKYLRSLWAEFRKTFGKCVWQFAPYKEGDQKKVFFGFMDIGLSDSFQVYINYSKKGCIKKINFASSKDLMNTALKDRFDLVNKNAFDNIDKSLKFYFKHYFETLHGVISNYSGSNFEIRYDKTNSRNSLTIEVKGFDKPDALSKTAGISNKIYSLLSAATNTVVLPIDLKDKDFQDEKCATNTFIQDWSW